MARPFYNHASVNSNLSSPRNEFFSSQESLLWKCIILAALTYLIWSDKISIVLDLSPTPIQVQSTLPEQQRVKASMLLEPTEATKPQQPKLYSHLVLPPNSNSNSTFFIDPGFAKRNQLDPSVVKTSTGHCKDYVARFAPVAVAEMHKYGIPASIILAQGLLESNAGTSIIATRTNNHFGMKCYSNRCKSGHCMNFEDDSHKDFFIKYSSVWSSYRDHSKLLKNNRRYAHLFKLGKADFRGWAKGLAKAGYASDNKYAEKLIALIMNMQLDSFDQQ